MNAPRRILMVFAKAPIPGYSKTRLIPSLGEEGAAKVQQELLSRTLERCVRSQEWHTQLWCAPDCQHPVFVEAGERHGLELRQQYGTDLGERMRNAFTDNFPLAEEVVVIGTDCPAIEAARLRQAFAALFATSDVVINPAQDGGYVLLGMRRLISGVFNEISWGSGQVMQQTRQRLNNEGVSYLELPELWDVDEIDDFRRYQALAMV